MNVCEEVFVNQKKSRYEIVFVDRVPVVVPVRDYTVRLARAAQALYPMITSSASFDSSSLHLPLTENVGGPASEEVSECAESETNKPAA